MTLKLCFTGFCSTVVCKRFDHHCNRNSFKSIFYCENYSNCWKNLHKRYKTLYRSDAATVKIFLLKLLLEKWLKHFQHCFLAVFLIPVPWSLWRRACCRERPSSPAGDWHTGSDNGSACWWRPSSGTSASSSSGSVDTEQQYDASVLKWKGDKCE